MIFIVKENGRLALSRYIKKEGVKFYELAEENYLEGIVAKLKDSKYYLDKRTKDWIKIKNLKDDDFVACGYMQKENNVVSIVLGQYHNAELIYKGHVTLGISSSEFNIISSAGRGICPFGQVPPGNDNATWLELNLVCTVKYMMKTANDSLRQPVFKGLRDDKLPEECTT